MNQKNKESNQNELNKKKGHIWSLTPKILTEEKDINKIKPYLDALKAGISESDIKNIALTGDYGSGKSTVLQTFQNQNSQFEYLNLSLASFKDEGEDLETELKKLDKKQATNEDKKESIEGKLETLNRLIEVSILQQIIYQATPDEIPDSRFQRIVGISNKRLKWFAVGSILWLISFFILFRFGGLQKADPTYWTYSFEDLSLSTLLALPVFFIGIGFFMYRLGRVLSNSKISKVNIKGEIELGKELDKSILNKHLDEILYFFEQTDFDVVVIEDLDRFKNTQVFTKLREINLLLNKSKSIREQKRKIVFIYAVRDEMFVNSERVKFFDYIIPVIPFINPTNAKDQFYNLLKIEKLESELKDGFIEDVVTFIDDIDMRLLINVFQEFGIYKRQMGSGIILENLFAIILYKNLYPKDFTKLPRRNGNLFTFFKNKQVYTAQLISEIEEEIETLENAIGNIEDEKITDLDELKAIYLNALKKETDALEIKLGSKWIPFVNLNEDDNLISLIDQDEFEYRHQAFNSDFQRYDSGRTTGKIKFSKIENDVNNKHSYYDRQEFILNKTDNGIEECKEQLYDKNNLKKQIESWNIQKLSKKISIKDYLENFEHKDLMGNLLTNGYIDENYIDYVTLFHEAKIKLSDKEFIKKVKSGQSSDYAYYLTKPNEVIKEIPLKYFSRKEILNYHILGYLATFGESFIDKKNALIRLVCDAKTGTIDESEMFKFVDGYIAFYENPEDKDKLRTNGSIPKLVEILSSESGVLWNTLLSNNTTAKKHIDKYLKLFVRHSDPRKLANNTNNSRLKNYLNANSSVIDLFTKQNDSQKLATIIQLLEIKFVELVPKNSDNISIYDFIYENQHYHLTALNIKEILTSFNSEEIKIDLDRINKKNYTSIHESDCKSLKEYVEQNINEYLKNVFLKIPENKEESEESIISLLNNDKVNEELKEEIIKKQATKINDISNIENEANIIELMKYEKFHVSWSNIVSYFQISEEIIDLFLTDFLNKEDNYKELSKSKIPSELKGVEEEVLKNFSSLLIRCKGLNQKAYTKLLKCLHYSYSRWLNIDFSELQSEKVEFLIENHFLSLTQKNFDLLSENFEELKSNLLEKKQKHLNDALDDGELTLSEQDFDLIFDSNKVDENIKEELIKEYSRERIISDDKIAKLIGQISSKLNRDYLTYTELHYIFNNGGNTIKEKLILLNNHFEELDSSEIKVLVDSVSRSHANIFNTRKRQKFNTSKELETLAENLKRRGLVKNYHFQKDGTIIRFYPTA